MMERLQEKDDLNIYQFVMDMRKRRTFMVQTLVSTSRSALIILSPHLVYCLHVGVLLACMLTKLYMGQACQIL